MLKSILLVLDCRSVEHGPVNLALKWAAEFDSLLAGLAVIDEDVIHPVEAVPIGASRAKRDLDAARLHEQQVLAGSTLSAIALRCALAHVAFKPLEAIGQPAEEIVEEAQRFDLILLPRRLEGQDDDDDGVSSVLNTILKSAPRPVVAATDTSTDSEAVVVAYDGSLQAARTLQAFTCTGLGTKHPVHVISVHDDLLEAARRGNRALEYLAFHNVRATLHAEANEHPAASIMSLAEKVRAGLIVMGAYGKSRIREFFVGSVTRSLLAESATPLFLYH